LWYNFTTRDTLAGRPSGNETFNPSVVVKWYEGYNQYLSTQGQIQVFKWRHHFWINNGQNIKSHLQTMVTLQQIEIFQIHKKFWNLQDKCFQVKVMTSQVASYVWRWPDKKEQFCHRWSLKEVLLPGEFPSGNDNADPTLCQVKCRASDCASRFNGKFTLVALVFVVVRCTCTSQQVIKSFNIAASCWIPSSFYAHKR
jgi:hypothetical protein